MLNNNGRYPVIMEVIISIVDVMKEVVALLNTGFKILTQEIKRVRVMQSFFLIFAHN
jgi:hypothetical protein